MRRYYENDRYVHAEDEDLVFILKALGLRTSEFWELYKQVARERGSARP